jgi:hypothetical protein
VEIFILNTQNNGKLTSVQTKFVYSNGTEVEKTVNVQSEIPVSSSIKMIGDRMQNLYNGMSSYSSSLSSSIQLSTDSGDVTFTITSMSFDYNRGLVETNYTASKLIENGRPGDEHKYHAYSFSSLNQSKLHSTFVNTFITSSEDIEE